MSLNNRSEWIIFSFFYVFHKILNFNMLRVNKIWFINNMLMEKKIITVKNIRGYKLEFHYKSAPYTVKELVLELSKQLNDNIEQTEYKILLDGEILENNYDLSSHEHNSGAEFIYLRRAKKNSSDSLDNIAKYVMGLYLDTLLKNPSTIETLISFLPQNIFTENCTRTQAMDHNNVNEISNIITTYINNFNLPYNVTTNYPSLAIYDDQTALHVAKKMLSKFEENLDPSKRTLRIIGEENDDDNWTTDNESNSEEKNDENVENSEDENEDSVPCTCGYCGIRENIEQDDDESDEENNNNNIVNNITRGIVPDEIMDQFTENEKMEINTITNSGYSLFDTVQMYIACGKNADQTLNLLLSL